MDFLGFSAPLVNKLLKKAIRISNLNLISGESMQNGSEPSEIRVHMDKICTILCDYQSKRKPRWPYVLNLGRDETKLAECIYRDHLLLN